MDAVMSRHGVCPGAGLAAQPPATSGSLPGGPGGAKSRWCDDATLLYTTLLGEHYGGDA